MLIKRHAPMEPESPEANEWAELDRHLQELTDRYSNELGGNAYAAFNAITDFASQPPANRLLRRDRHSLQRLAGHWLADFTKQCRIPDFHFSSYVENFNATLNNRVSLSKVAATDAGMGGLLSLDNQIPELKTIRTCWTDSSN